MRLLVVMLLPVNTSKTQVNDAVKKVGAMPNVVEGLCSANSARLRLLSARHCSRLLQAGMGKVQKVTAYALSACFLLPA